MEFLKPLIFTVLTHILIVVYGIGVGIYILVNTLLRGKSYFEVKERPLRANCLTDPDFGRHHTVQLENGLKIHYVENGDQSKPMMLFVHGFPEFWFSWRWQLKHFAKTHWVVALDMRGYGDSDKPKEASAYKMDLLQSDIYQFVKALKRDKCILVGHDWGAFICFGVAARYPQIIDKLIILNGAHANSMAKKMTSSLTQLFKSWYIFMFQLPYLPEMIFSKNDLELLPEMFGPNVTAGHLQGHKYNWSKKGAWTPPINYYRQNFNKRVSNLNSEHPPIPAPTCIIWGEKDIALDKELAEMSVKCCKNAKIVYIPDGNHFVQQDKPKEVNEAIERFLGIKI